MLTFATPNDHDQASQLMQPCLIRVLDNLRKQTEILDWQSNYVERVLWPSEATEAQRQQVQALAAELDTASPEDVPALRQQLSQLPSPVPAYELQLTRGDQTQTLDIWELCFQVCFRDYVPQHPATVDETLLEDTGDIDWIALDEKARGRVEEALSRAVAA
ncbi:MAG: hypothetical protein ACFCVD_15015 [Nodosilinea sp.]